jgi:ribosomal protein L40E
MSSGSKEPLPETFPEDSITIRTQFVRDASEEYASPNVDEESLMKEMRIEVVREGPPLPPIICSKCGVQNEAAESRCWKCGLNLEENRNKKKDESDTTSNVVNIITSNSPKGWNLFAIVGLGIGFIAPIGTVFAILMTATAMMLGVNEGSPFFGLLWGGSFEIAFISGVAAFGGIICLLVALIQQRKQTTLTGSRNLLVGLALIVSIFPVICCILMLVVDLPYLFDSL